MRYFIMTCGCPGSGKSTWAHQRAEENRDRSIPTIVISPDEIRGELYGDPAIQGNPREVFTERNHRFIQAFDTLADGGEIIYDATNLRESYRIEVLKMVRAYDNVKAVLWFFLQPLEVLIERDKQRSRTVGEKVIKRMLASFTPPNPLKEDWDEIIFDESCANLDIHDYMDAMNNFDQHNPHHTMNLYNHCLNTWRNVFQFHIEKETAVASMWHDVGKLYTQQFDKNGVAHYYNHAAVSAYYSLMFDYDGVDKIKVALLIANHMKFFDKGLNMDKMRHDYGEDFVRELELLHAADIQAH